MFALKRVIEKRDRNDKEWQAKLAKMEIKGAPAPLNISPKKRKEYTRDAVSLLDRMKKEHREKYGSGTADKD